jgi:hypothetical protein
MSRIRPSEDPDAAVRHLGLSVSGRYVPSRTTPRLEPLEPVRIWKEPPTTVWLRR